VVGDPYEADDNDPAYYPATRVLKNVPGLHDQAELDEFEVEMVTLRSEEGIPEGAFGPAHYRAIHRHLFQDIYEWAGKHRTIRTGKGGNWFCYPEYIDGQMDALFARLDAPQFQPGAGREVFISALAAFVGELNAIHPFREGNGRTQLVLIRLLGQRAGHPFRLEAVEADEFLEAMIATFNGDCAPLIDELERMLA
jgi:cell filamentation protein